MKTSTGILITFNYAVDKAKFISFLTTSAKDSLSKYLKKTSFRNTASDLWQLKNPTNVFGRRAVFVGAYLTNLIADEMPKK